MAFNISTKLLTAVVVAFSILVSASPAPLNKRYAIKDHHPAPRGWNNVGRCPDDHTVDLSIGLTQGNFQELERELYAVSDPRSPRYGQHLSAEEVNDLIRPTQDTSEAVHQWLTEHGIESHHMTYSPAKDWIKVSLPVKSIEKLLDTEYSIWEHEDGSMLARTESWSLPLHLHERVSTIQPTNSWARLNPNVKFKELDKRSSQVLELPDEYFQDIPLLDGSNVTAVCNFSAVTPNCLRTLYGTVNYTTQAGNQSQMGLTDFLGEYNNRSDAYVFLSQYRPEAAEAAYEFKYTQVGGGVVDTGIQHADDDTGLEGNLDAQYMLGIAWPLNLTAYTTGGHNPSYIPAISTPTNSDEPFLKWINFVLGQNVSDVPQVISTSYADDEQTVSRAYAEAVCNQFAQLGARGVTLLFASGDYGVGLKNTCYSNKDNTTKAFIANFPNTCPYVTSVGGTYMYPEQAAYAHLSGNRTFASGGGFSNYFDTPDYQTDVVSQYIDSLNGSYDGLYNQSGRAYPDISCVAQRFPVIWNGTTHSLVGTSGSTPICASILAIVNDALLANNKSVLGFLNPWLYSSGNQTFTDVTNGSAYGCETDGFPAMPGWDAVTGWGTPYFLNITENLGIGNGTSNDTSGGMGEMWM